MDHDPDPEWRTVHAAWELASGNDASKLTVYVDRDTIQRSGNW